MLLTDAILSAQVRVGARKLQQLARQHPFDTATMPSALVDAGGTPPWYLPASVLNESSLRSTLAQNDTPQAETRLPNPQQEAGEASKQTLPAANASTPTSTAFKAANHLPNDKPASHAALVPRIVPTTSETFRQHYGRQIPDLRIDMYEIGEHELAAIDHHENRVYHIGLNNGGSYSGRFGNKSLLPEAKELLAGVLASKAAKEAKALRYRKGARMERLIRAHLSAGGILILDQTSPRADQNTGIECHLPGCLSRSKSIPPANLYLDLQHASPSLAQGHPGIHRQSSSSGESLIISGSPVKEPLDIPQLDGDEDEVSNCNAEPVHNTLETGGANGNNGGLRASRWATIDHEVAQPGPARLPTPEPGQDKTDEDGAPASPVSIDSTGEWQYPPRRFQYIASFIEPSATLPPEYRAAVFLWKAASKTQLSWEQHLEKLRCLREDHTGTSLLVEHTEKDFQIENDDYGEEEITTYEAQSGSRKKDCYGNVLSVVLAGVKCEH
ncbi:hypothetical protein BST61_g496 [Cercospora zeina]